MVAIAGWLEGQKKDEMGAWQGPESRVSLWAEEHPDLSGSEPNPD
jgi:hypothetical protein